MYKRVETVDRIVMDNGELATPVATLMDEHGGTSHFIIDDGCYVLVNMGRVGRVEGEPELGVMTPWIYPEALKVLKGLPAPRRRLAAV